MSSKKFEIFRIGSDGEIHRHLICLGGRVSVFRANREALLEEFRVALQGRFPVAQFRIVLDGKKFQSADHVLIGFGERFERADEGNLRDYLETNGMGDVDIDYSLKCYGLEGLESAPLSTLSETQQRILRLISATTKASERVIILNDPFENLTSELREDLSSRVADFAYRTSAIVIVTRLTDRPESWIDNPIISRVQLERPRRETIGAGGGGIDPDIQQLRQQIAAQGNRELTRPAPKPQDQPPPKREVESSALRRVVKDPVAAVTEHKTFSILLAAAYLAVFASIPWVFGKGFNRQPPPQPVVVVAKTPPPAATPFAVRPVGFKGLPKNIQENVMLAFRDPDTLLRSIPVNLDRRTPIAPDPVQVSRPLPPPTEPPAPRVLSEPASTDAYSPEPNPAAVTNTEELERRREEIRQRLLSAIMARRQQLLEQQQQQQQ